METNAIEVINQKQLTFARVWPGSTYNLDNFQEYDAVIIEYTGRQAVYELIRAIRSHDEESIYLLPIFLHKFYREQNPNIARFADGIINDLDDLTSVSNITFDIKDRL